MIRFLFSISLLMLSFTLPAQDSHTVLPGGRYRVVDLTHPFSPETIYWPNAPYEFEMETLYRGKTEGGWFYTANAFRTPEHGGTHMDAPIHFFAERDTVDRVPLERLIAPAVVIDVSEQATNDRDYRLRVEDVKRFEKRHGPIPEGAVVLLRTGWAQYWPDRRAYMGDDTPGATDNLSFPGYGAEATRLLMRRGVAGLGVDTASIDRGKSTDFMAHRIAAEQNVYGLENLAGLDQLPPTGATVIVLPMKIENGSGAPVRAIALVPVQ